jgi:hypothetical protein
MDNFLIYCKPDTLNCTSENINSKLEANTLGYIQINDSLWLVKLKSGYIGTYLHKDEYLMDIVLRDYITPQSFIIIAPLQDAHWELPLDIHQFLVDDPDIHSC